MQLVDSHAHIYLKEFKDDLNNIIDRARESGVGAIFMPNIDHTTIEDMLEVEQKFPGYCIPMMGLHPCSVGKNIEKELYEVEDYLSKGGFAAVGEIGTDLYWDKSFWSQQQEALKIQLEMAKKHELPFVIHCRESIDETIAIVESAHNDILDGVFHCFTGSTAQAISITAMGFKLGIGGVATFKNGGLEAVIKETPLDKILLETDSPYLAPVPFRGKRNEPAYLMEICRRIAKIKDLEEETVANKTTYNSYSLFKKLDDKKEFV